MAGEEEILKDLNYSNYIYLFNNPYDVHIAKAPLTGDSNDTAGNQAQEGLGIDRKLQVGKNFYNNNDNTIASGFLKAGIQTTIDGTTAITPQEINAEPNGGPIVFSDKNRFGDFPKLISTSDSNDGLRNGEVINNIVFVAGNLTKINSNLDNKFTNDFGYNPKRRHEFEINTSKGTVFYNFVDFKLNSYKALHDSGYQLIPQSLESYGALDHSSKLLKAKQDNQVIETPPNQPLYYAGPPIIYNLFDGTDFSSQGVPGDNDLYRTVLKKAYGISEEDLKLYPTVTPAKANYGAWTYRQEFYFSMYIQEEPSDDPPNPDAQRKRMLNYLSYISTPFGSTPEYWSGGLAPVQDKYASEYNNFSKVIHNCSTKIGVPYDYQTIVKDAVDLKTVGVKNTTPKYESVYNYYDPQYEPQALALINEQILNENALTSVYDFIFRPLNKELYDAFLSYPQSLTTATGNRLDLSFVNGFLDNVSSNYNNYLKATIANQEAEDPAASITPGFSTSIPEYTLNTWTPKFQNNGSLANMYDPDNIFNTEKSNFLTYLELNEDFANEVKISKGTSIPKWLEEVKAGIYFSEDVMYLFNKAKEYKDFFPFVNTINLPQEKRGPLAKIFAKYDLLDGINTHAASLVVPNDSIVDGNTEATPRTYANFYGGLVNAYSPENFNMFNEVKLKTFKMHFIESSAKNQQEDGVELNVYDDYSNVDLFLDTFQDIGLETAKNVFIYSEKNTSSTTDLLQLLGVVKKQGLFGEIEEFVINGGMRTPRDIQKGKLAHQETLMYEIAKYEVVGGQERFIQSIFLPIVNQEELDYVDTQVVPYKDYFYKIFAHKVIVGTKYKAKRIDIGTGTIEGDQNTLPYVLPNKLAGEQKVIFPENHIAFRHEYEIVPYLQFVRVPYYNTPMVNIQTDALNFSRIEDYPPIPPQVQVIPYRNVKNKVLFLLNNSLGEMKTTVVPIMDNDLNLFDQCAIHQGVKLPSKDYLSEITFRGDDIARTFTMFRMERKPVAYRDFSEDDTSVTFDFYPGQTSFVDNIVPNTDYYYAFRSTDIHGKISNPTEVYKIRIISNKSSAPYLKVETFDPREEALEKDKRLSTTKTFQKYLLLGLNKNQNEVKYTNVEYNDSDQALGNHLVQPVTIDSKAFGKKYKLRITSKQTGRKIDINIDFKNPKNIINDK